MKNLTIPMFVILTVFSCSCKKSKDGNKEIIRVTTCYDETKGSDLWSKGENDTVLVSNVKNYLLADTITVYNVSISNDGTFEACKATTCKTGRRIKTIINSTDLNKIQKLRFYECK